MLLEYYSIQYIADFALKRDTLKLTIFTIYSQSILAVTKLTKTKLSTKKSPS